MGAGILELSESTFQSEVLESATPVLVDFWAPWCGPCRAIAPALQNLADEMGSQAKVTKVNVDNNGGLAGQYGINSIPALLVFKGGDVVEKFIGVVSKDVLANAIKKHL
jgi:thioredoxin 1